MVRGPVNLPKGFDPGDKAYKKWANKLPTRQTCDLTDPREMFLWTYVALPGMNGGQMAFPSSYGMVLSQHQFDVGVMLTCPECGHSKTPEKQYVPPAADDPHWMTSPGKWVKPEQVPAAPVDPMDSALDRLTASQQAALLRRLKQRDEEGRL